MTEEFVPKTPDFKGDGIAIWKNEIKEGDNKGKTYLSVSILGGKAVNCFPYTPKPKVSKQKGL